MLAQRAFLLWLAVVTGACPCSAQSADASALAAANVAAYPRADRLSQEDQLAVIGDLQRTSFWGRLVLAESNLAEQKSLLDDLARQRFRALVLLGDMVFSAGDDNWHYFDGLMAPLRREPAFGAVDEPTAERRPRWFFPVM
ncbi:MAG TPA: hypothetical protein VGC79_30765, partial [Polyangiaceae bacterium]